MKLVSASSPGMESAHKHIYVRTVANILLQDRNLLAVTASLIKEFSSCEKLFEEKLNAFCLNQSRPDMNGVLVVPEHIIELTDTLRKLYQQPDEKVGYQRGAIVEQLVCGLISCRYNSPDDQCLTNQRFTEQGRAITVQEVDVAALSNKHRKAEAYECKVSASSFKPYDVINLSDLVNAVSSRYYHVNVGFVAFEKDLIMRRKCRTLDLPDTIKLYGLDSIESLGNLTLLDN